VERYRDLLRDHGRSGCGLETSSFLTIVKEDGIRWRGTCSICLEAKERIKPANSATVHNSRFKFICGAPHWFITNDVNVLRSEVGYVKTTVLSEMYLGSHQADFSENPHRVHQYHVMKF